MNAIPLETRPERLWREFAEARDKAIGSNDINDGIEAGRAWSRFLAEYVPEGGAKRAAHGHVIGGQHR